MVEESQRPKPTEQPIVQTSPALPPEAEKAMEKIVAEGGPKALMAVFGAFSRTTTFGPDPETARVLAEAEKHEEDCRLDGYKAMLSNRENQNQRDHQFRIKRLNHETSMQIIVLVVTVIGIAIGLYEVLAGNNTIGGYVLLASFLTMIQILTGKSPPFRKE